MELLRWVILTFSCTTADAAITVAKTDFMEFPDNCIRMPYDTKMSRKAKIVETITFIHKDDGRILEVARLYSPMDNKQHFSAGETEMMVW